MSMLFDDRADAGKQLAKLLTKYTNNKDAVVIGLPRGGVVTAFEVAKALHLPLDVVFPRKVGAPYQPELAIGAVTETGDGVFNKHIIDVLGIPEDYIKDAAALEMKIAQQRLQLYRKSRPKVILKDKIVIVVDDGLATGATMKAAIASIKKEGAKQIVVAVPVSPPETLEDFRKIAEEVFAVQTPHDFQAVGQFYREFSATEDEEVVRLLQVSLN